MSENPENDPIAASIALMQAQIAKLQSAIETLEGVRPLIATSAVPGFIRNGADVSFSHDTFFGMKAADAAKLYLSKVKKTTPPKAIADALIEGGWKTSSQNPAENIRTILNRNSAFVVIKGEFGLAEWYPGRKAAAIRPRPVTRSTDSLGAEENDPEAPMQEPSLNVE